ncbi:MAG: hypothetical protein M1838_002448 [Thelocarpon superellum]|nr:MAG: hypothetical protein M1838_002448 [Thelocarpon superellum]
MSPSSNKIGLSTSTSDATGPDPAPRRYSSSKRFGGETASSLGRSNPFNAVASSTAAVSPSVGASKAFGLGSGAFASFGAAKGPKTPGGTLDFGALPSPSLAVERREQGGVEGTTGHIKPQSSSSSLTNSSSRSQAEHPLKYTWVVWYRPPTSKYSDYEKSTIALVAFSSVETFWTAYAHLKRPSSLPSVSDYHIFKKGIRPVWEDDENRRGGKWIVRLKKGVADRYWEELLLGIVGDQFAEAGEEVCGAVLSVRGGEDVLSVWTRIDGGRNIKIRETIKRLLAFPPDTNIVWRSHDESIAQRSAIDQARQEKSAGGGHHSSEKRSIHAREDSTLERSMPS